MQDSGLKEVVIGVGHLRRQVDFYTQTLGLRIQARGRIAAATSAALWAVDEEIAMVRLRRNDLPSSLALRLVPAFDLPARPDFKIETPGPLGFLFGTEDITRVFYRLSGAGVEFYGSPVEVGPRGPHRRRQTRHLAFGRAYDGEYIALAQPLQGPLLDGSVSPYFGVSEPLEISFVVCDPDAASRFLEEGLGFETVLSARRSGTAREQAMGLAPGTAFTLQTLKDPLSELRVSLLCFGTHGVQTEIRPPARGISALRFHCLDVQQSFERCLRAGGRANGRPLLLDDPADGHGLGVSLMSPLGTQIELWQSLHDT